MSRGDQSAHTRGAGSAGNGAARAARPNPGALLAAGIKLAPKALKMAKLGKVALFGASVGAYGLLFSWPFAFILVGAILFHEMGHVVAMRWYGVPVKGIYLIPFVGGVAVGDPTRVRLSEWQQYVIALMGPLIGLGTAVVPLAIHAATGNAYAAAAAGWVALLNLFNLLPIYPLDGGRILRALFASAGSGGVKAAMVVSLGLGAGLLWWWEIPLLAFILVIGAIEFYVEVRRGSDAPAMTWGSTAVALGGYVLLAVALIAVMAAVHASPAGGLAFEMLRG